MNPPHLEPLDAKDKPVVDSFEHTWKAVPFTTFKYFATSKGKTFDIPGGNCFNFAIDFNKSYNPSGSRLMCHKDHGSASTKSKTEDRYYTVDSGFFTPVKMPAITSRKELSFSVVNNVPAAINKPDSKVKNAQTMYDLNYDTTKHLWGIDHYIKGQTGFVKMVETPEAQALELAKTNALKQNASIFLSRLLKNGVHSWGVSVFLSFKKGSGAKGDIIVKLPNAGGNDTVITVNVHDKDFDAAFKNLKTKLASRIVSDGLTNQWTDATSKCFDYLVGELKK